MRNFVKSQAVEVVKPKSKKLAPWSNKNTKDSSSTNLAVTRTTNELFIDILEHISATFNASGNIINSSINGTIISKSYIMGTPAFKMKFCDKVNIDEDSTYGIKIDNASFNSCVNFSDFELNKTLIMKPPRGTCEIMQYRITKDFNYPFKFHSFINEKSNFKLEFTVKVRFWILTENLHTKAQSERSGDHYHFFDKKILKILKIYFIALISTELTLWEFLH